jgi:quercetin dioxygenase-like cupin family protein
MTLQLDVRFAAFAATVLAAACTPGAEAPEAEAQQPPESALAIAASEASLQWGPCPPIFLAGCEIAVLHGDPAQPNADVFLRVPGGYNVPAHTHSSAERMILVTCQMQVDYQGAPPATLNTGMYAYGPPGVPHSAVCSSSEACTLFIAFVAPVDANPHEGSVE